MAKNLKYKTGDTIIIKVNSKDYQTIIDNDGVQRFMYSNKAVWLIFKNMTDSSNRKIRRNLITDFEKGVLTSYQLFDIFTNFEYTVGGLLEMNMFEDFRIKNPYYQN
jgi:hypothetical protein